MMAVATVYPGRDNTLDYVLTEDGQPYSLAAVTRVAVRLGDTTVDSAVTPYAVIWEQRAVKFRGKIQTLWMLSLRLGGQTIPSGEYQARIDLYAPAYLNGLVWVDDLRIRVADAE